MKVGFAVKEAARSLKRNRGPSFAALTAVLVTMLVVGIFIPVLRAPTGAATEVRGPVLVDVVLKTTAKPADVRRVRTLIGRTPHAGKVVLASPATLRVTPDRRDAALALHDPAIATVRNHQDATRTILTSTKVVKFTLAGLAAVLGAASVLLVATAIRRSLSSHRREVEVMKLVGATNRFIRRPFLFEGLIVGAVGSALAILLLGAGTLAALDPLANRLALFAAPRTIAFAELAGVILLTGMVLSAAGSGLSLRRLQRV